MFHDLLNDVIAVAMDLYIGSSVLRCPLQVDYGQFAHLLLLLIRPEEVVLAEYLEAAAQHNDQVTRVRMQDRSRT